MAIYQEILPGTIWSRSDGTGHRKTVECLSDGGYRVVYRDAEDDKIRTRSVGSWIRTMTLIHHGRDEELKAAEAKYGTPIGSKWRHRDGTEYVIVDLVNLPDEERYPLTITYQGENGRRWGRYARDWRRSMTLISAQFTAQGCIADTIQCKPEALRPEALRPGVAQVLGHRFVMDGLKNMFDYKCTECGIAYPEVANPAPGMTVSCKGKPAQVPLPQPLLTPEEEQRVRNASKPNPADYPEISGPFSGEQIINFWKDRVVDPNQKMKWEPETGMVCFAGRTVPVQFATVEQVSALADTIEKIAETIPLGGTTNWVRISKILTEMRKAIPGTKAA